MKTNKERLLEVQKKFGFSQKELGAYIGVSTRTINSWMGKAESRECPDHLVELIERVAEADIKAIEADEQPTTMMRWTYIFGSGMDEWMIVCGSKADALREAASGWDSLTDREKQYRKTHAVALLHVQLYKDGHGYQFTSADMGDGWADADWYDTAKNWLE